MGVYNVNAAVHNVNGGVYKVNEQLLNSLSTRVNKTHATFTNVNAAAPNAGGDVSKTSQVRSAYFRNHLTQPEVRYWRDPDLRWEPYRRWTSDGSCGFENVAPLLAKKVNDWVPERYGQFRTLGRAKSRLVAVRKVSDVLPCCAAQRVQVSSCGAFVHWSVKCVFPLP